MSGFSASLLNAVSAAQPITVTASPFTWTNTTGNRVVVYVSGGTVTAINAVVAASDILVGLIAGAVTVRPGDGVKVAYAVAPTMSYVAL